MSRLFVPKCTQQQDDAPEVLEAALSYLRQGISIVPCCSPRFEPDGTCVRCNEHPERPKGDPKRCESPGKASLVPWKALQQRPPTEAEVRGWYHRWRTANVAIVTGSASGLAVLDTDSAEAFANAQACGLDGAPIVESGKGRHIYFADRDGKLRNFAGRLPNLDLRANGGIIVAPPSLHRSGRRYAWSDGEVPDLSNAPPLPEWIVSLANHQTIHPEGVGGGDDDEILGRAVNDDHAGLDLHQFRDGVPEGRRDQELQRLAGLLRRECRSLPLAELTIQLAALNCEPPFDPDLATEKVVRAWRAYDSGFDHDLAGVAVPFPSHVLPPIAREYVETSAGALRAPLDFVAVPFLAAAGAVIGGRLELELKAGYREGANLYVADVGDTGTKKTPSQMAALDPLLRIQRRLDRDFDRAYAEYEGDLRSWKATGGKERGPSPTEPLARSLYTTNATTEALAMLLHRDPAILLKCDEMLAWIGGFNQYKKSGKGSDEQDYLSMWSGAPLKIDRKGSSRPIIVHRPRLSVVCNVPPTMLAKLTDTTMSEDGFLDRILWAYPQSVPDSWLKDTVPADILGAMREHFELLYQLRRPTDEFGDRAPQVIRLTPEADELWGGWYDANALETSSPTLGRLRGPWAKMPAQLARVALILHALSTGRLADAGDPDSASVVDDLLSVETLMAAVEVIDYFKSQARRVYANLKSEGHGARGAAARGGTDLEVLALRVRAAFDRDRRLTRTQLLHDVLGGHVSRDDLDLVMARLEEERFVAPFEVVGGGRPAKGWYLIEGDEVGAA